MKKSFSSTLVLTVVFGLVLGWYLLWEKKFRPEREKKQDQAKELLQIPVGDIQEIVVERAKLPTPGSKEAKGESVSYETIRVKRVAGRWTLVEPLADSGDDSAIQNLASTLASTKYEEVLQENVQDWKPYGLAEPKIKITAVKDAQTKASLLIGNDTPVGYGTYVRKPDSNALYQTGRALRTAFERKIEDLREKKILNWTRADVDEVEIHSMAGEVIVKHNEGDKWTLARQDLPVDDNEWNKSLNALLELRASGFATEKAKDLSAYGLSKPTITAQLTKSGSKERLTISFGRVKDKNYVKRSDRDTIYEVSKEGLDLLARSAMTFADMKIAHFNRYQVKRIRIEHLGSGKDKKESVELAKSGADWRVESDGAAKISTQKVDAFLTSLQDTKAISYSTPSKAAPTLKIILTEETSKGGKPEEHESASLSFSPAGANVLGSRTGLARAFTIKMTDFKTFNLGKADFAEETNSEGAQKAPEKKPKS